MANMIQVALQTSRILILSIFVSLIFIFAIFSNAHAQEKTITAIIDSTKIEESLKDFPVLIRLGQQSGMDGSDTTAFINEMMPDSFNPNDDFTGIDGGVPDPDNWIIANDGDISIQNNRLVLKADSNDHSVQIVTKDLFWLTGDFDIQIDFEILAGPSSQNWHGWIRTINKAGHFIRVMRSFDSANHHIKIEGYDGISYVNDGSITTSSTNGKLRLVRNGSVFSAYAWIDDQWILVGTGVHFQSDEDLYINIGAYCANNYPRVEIAFDNFTINSGQIRYVANAKKFTVETESGQKCFTEIEEWDSVNKTALVWARIPEIAPNADTRFKITYGSDMADQDTRDYQEVNDDFTGEDGTAPDIYKWRTDAAIQTDSLKLRADNSDTYQEFISNFYLIGDFDVQVDFSLVDGTAPAETKWETTFFLKIPDKNNFQYRLGRLHSSDIGYIVATLDGSSWVKLNHQASSERDGKFRIQRTGSTMKFYYWSGSDWTLMHTESGCYTHPTRIGAYNYSKGNMPTVETLFDNFIVNSGTVSGYVGFTGEAPAKNVWDDYFKGVWHLSDQTRGITSEVIDSTWYFNNGEGAGQLTQLTSGLVGNAQGFDGSNDYILIPDNGSLDISTHDTTLEALVKVAPSQLEDWQGTFEGAIIGKGYLAPADGHGLYVIDNHVNYMARTVSDVQFAASDQTQNDKNWRHYAGVLDRSATDGIKLFIDSVPQSITGDGSLLAGINLDNAHDMGIGARHLDGQSWQWDFNGEIDEVRLTRGIARSPSWIKATYHSHFDELIAYRTPTTDTDSDGLPDLEEMDIHGTNPNSADTDGDGLSDFDEVVNMPTDARYADSDFDGINDSEEQTYWGADWNADTDGDGVVNIIDGDSDNDGVADGAEIAHGTDPGDAASVPLTAANTVDVEFGLWADEHQGGGGLIANGVRLINGNVVDARSDLKLSSPHGLGFSLQAFYNSRSSSAGAMGNGWRHSFEISFQGGLAVEGNPAVRITDETGQAHYFQDAGAGQFVPLLHDRTALVLEGADYVWKRLDGTRVGFASNGRLAWIDDAVGNRLILSYDGQGRLSTVTDAITSRSIAFTYNSDDRVDSVQGPATTVVPTGVYAAYDYDTAGNLTSVLYSGGSGFDYAYNDANDPTNLTDKHNKAGHLLASWGYDGQDRCIDSYTPHGIGVGIVYNSATQITVTDDYNTSRVYTLSTVDGNTRITALQGPAAAPYADSSMVRWVYDVNLNLTEVEDARGTIHQYLNIDTRGNPGEVILAAGTSDERRVQLAWHPNLRALLSRSELSVLGGGVTATTWDYDTDGNTQANEAPGPLATRIIASGYTHNAVQSPISFEYITTVSHNAQGQITAIDGPKPGAADTTTFVYDTATKDLEQVARPIVGATRYENYDGLGRIGRVVEVNGQTTNFTYDARGRITDVTHAADSTSRTIFYNMAGLPETVTDEDGVVTTYEYDPANGYLTRVNDSEGNYIGHTYDTRGNRIETAKYTGAGVRKSRNRWDFNHPTLPGMLWRNIKHNDAYSEYGYDAVGNPVSVRDFNGHTTATTFDALGRPLTVTEPGTNGVTRYTYDSHGNLSLVEDAEGRQTAYVFDDLGRTLSVDSSDSGLATHVYDEAGNLSAKTDARGIAVSYAYDDLNRLTQMTFPDPVENITYTYDAGDHAMGRLTSIADPSGTTAFSYDARGRLERKIASVLGQDYTLLRLFTAAGRSLGYSYPSGRMVNYTRDANGRVDGATTQHNGNMIELFSNMTYKPFGAPSGLNNGAGGSVSSISTDCGCLEVTNPGGKMEQQYTYDDNGNVTAITWTNLPGYNQTYAYDELNRLTTATNPLGNFGFSYDKVGNRLTRTKDTEVETYTYQTDANRLATVTGAASVNYGYDNGGNITAIGDRTLVYNKAGRLQRVEEDAAVLGEYTYNALGQRITKTVDGIVTVFHYDFDGNIFAESGTDGTFTREYIYTMGNRFATVDVSTDKVYYYLNDHLGTPVFMTDENNVVVWEATYPPFGNADISPSAEIENNFRFAGQYYDAETGLHYNYHRYYDPATGRYLTPDPIGLAGGINLFTYTSNNPINAIDPYGLYESPAFLRYTVPGQIQYDYGRTALENGQYGWAAAHFTAMVGEQVIFALTLGQAGLAKAGGQCVLQNSAASTAGSIFKHGQLFQRTIQTSKGPVDVMAETVISGKLLHLKDIVIYGRSSKPLTGITKEIIKARGALINEARAAGFQQLRISGVRHPTSTSANPGKVVDLMIDLTK